MEIREGGELAVGLHLAGQQADGAREVAQALSHILHPLRREGIVDAARLEQEARDAIAGSRHHGRALQRPDRSGQGVLMPEGFRHEASHAAHLSAGVGIERPGGVGRIGGVRIDEVGRVAPERAIDDMAGAFGEATFLVAGKAAVEIAVVHALERAHSLVDAKRREIEDGQRHNRPLQRRRLDRAQELVDGEGGAIFIAVDAAMDPQDRPVLRPAQHDDRQFDRGAVGKGADGQRALEAPEHVGPHRTDLDCRRHLCLLHLLRGITRAIRCASRREGRPGARRRGRTAR